MAEGSWKDAQFNPEFVWSLLKAQTVEDARVSRFYLRQGDLRNKEQVLISFEGGQHERRRRDVKFITPEYQVTRCDDGATLQMEYGQLLHELGGPEKTHLINDKQCYHINVTGIEGKLNQSHPSTSEDTHEAGVMHYDGPLTMTMKWGEHLRVRISTNYAKCMWDICEACRGHSSK